MSSREEGRNARVMQSVPTGDRVVIGVGVGALGNTSRNTETYSMYKTITKPIFILCKSVIKTINRIDYYEATNYS